MDYTQSIGNVNELQCMSAFIQLGYDCSIPFGNSSKYDFIADINGTLIKVQCKSSHYVKNHGVVDYNAIYFNTTSSTTNTNRTVRHTYDLSQIDFFATYFEGNTYIIPVNECSTGKTLRFSPPSNGNKNYNKAEDYLIGNYFKEGIQYLKSKEIYLNRPIIQSNKSSYTCSMCGKSVSKQGNLCKDCSHSIAQKVERPTKEELKDLIRRRPFTQIGALYKVSDNTIRKWCKSYNLPFKVCEIKQLSDSEWDNI